MGPVALVVAIFFAIVILTISIDAVFRQDDKSEEENKEDTSGSDDDKK